MYIYKSSNRAHRRLSSANVSVFVYSYICIYMEIKRQGVCVCVSSRAMQIVLTCTFLKPIYLCACMRVDDFVCVGEWCV